MKKFKFTSILTIITCIFCAFCTVSASEVNIHAETLDRLISEVSLKDRPLDRYKAVCHGHKDILSYYLNEARHCRDVANNHLAKADDYSNKIKSLDIRERIKNVTKTCISSVIIPDAKTKLLVIGLSVLADIVAEIGIDRFYDYSSIKYEWTQAAISFEECNYYNSLALSAPMHTKNIQDNLCNFGQNLEDSIRFMIIIEMYTATLEHRESSLFVSNEIAKIRKQILDEFSNTGTISKVYSEKIDYIREDLDEVIAYSEDKDWSLSHGLQDTFDKTIEKLEYVEDYLKLIRNE